MLASIFPPIHREGYKFIAIFAGVALVSFLLWDLLGWLVFILTIWCYYFFRDPERVTPDREGVVVSPADGVVCLVGPATPPVELELGDEPRERICVFMNVFNCHVNRVPMGGTIEKIAYRPGTFLNASLDKASENNERNSVAIRLQNGASIAVVQIAGLVARRILCEITEGQKLATGDRFGLIRFGSRVDVYLPKGASPLAAVGQTMVAGETVIAEFASSDATPASTMQ